MNATLKKFWRTTTENAIWIFYTINALFSVSDVVLLYMTTITIIGVILYYANALITLSLEPNMRHTRDSWQIILDRLWRITEANGLRLTMSISAIFYLEGQLFTNALIMTLISFILFYTYAYETMPYLPAHAVSKPQFNWGTFLRTLWSITELNVLIIVGALSLFLFVNDKTLPYTATAIGIGMVLFYRDEYRAYHMYLTTDSKE